MQFLLKIWLFSLNKTHIVWPSAAAIEDDGYTLLKWWEQGVSVENLKIDMICCLTLSLGGSCEPGCIQEYRTGFKLKGSSQCFVPKIKRT